jgi:hypothetical protein
MRVLVTGGAGFIGSAVCRLLVGEMKATVLDVDKLTYAANLGSLRTIEDDPATCLAGPPNRDSGEGGRGAVALKHCTTGSRSPWRLLIRLQSLAQLVVGRHRDDLDRIGLGLPQIRHQRRKHFAKAALASEPDKRLEICDLAFERHKNRFLFRLF